MTNLTGQSIGRYHILEQLGEGGMATVYKAYDTRLEREVALKVLRTDQFIPAQLQMVLQRFEREAKSLAKLSHPNIVNILDYGEHEGMPYLVMEYLPGGTLKQKLGHALPWQEAVRLLIPIAQGLAYAHGRGIIHRDVKPANILLKESGTPVLTDFGIAKLLEAGEGHTLTGSGVGIGTPEYMAPEQGIGAKVVDARADIYSLGIVLYEMVTGRKPYMADTPMAVVLKQMTDPLPCPTDFAPDLPEKIEYLLLKALAKQPDDRYPDMNAMLASMESLVMEVPTIPVTPKETVAAAPPTVVHVPAPQPKKKVPFRPKISPKVILAIAGALVIVLLAIFGLLHLKKPVPAAPNTAAVAIAPTSSMFTPVSPNANQTQAANTPSPTATAFGTPATPPTAVAAAPTTIPLAWTQIFSEAKLKPDTISAVVIDPSNPLVIYAGTMNSGIYKSSDGGKSWQPVNKGLGIARVDSLAIDPSDPDILYAGVVLRGIYKTTDGGAQWQRSGQEGADSAFSWISQVVLDPQDSQHLFLNGFGQLFETKDGGANWQPVPMPGCPAKFTNLVIHPKNSLIWYASEAGSSACKAGVYKTKDGGQSWTNLDVVEEIIQPGVLKIDHQTGAFLYVGSRNNPILYSSQDGGETWRTNILNGTCSALAVDFTDGKTVYCVIGGVEISTDAGKTWKILRVAIHGTILLSPQSQKLLYAAGMGGFYTLGGATSWSKSSFGLGGCPPELMFEPSQKWGLYVFERMHACNPGWDLGGVDYNNLHKTADYGKTWLTLESKFNLDRSNKIQHIRDLAFDASGRYVYWLTSGTDLAGLDKQNPPGFLDKEGVLIKDRAPDRNLEIARVVANPYQSGIILVIYSDLNVNNLSFALGKQFIALSTNRGFTWQHTTPVEMPYGARFFFDQDRGQAVYVLQPTHQEGASNFFDQSRYEQNQFFLYYALQPAHDDGIIYRSLDGGKNWGKCASPIPADNPSLVPREVALFDKSRAYLATQGGGILVSSDDCKSWTPSNTGLGSLYVNTVAVDPNNPATVYAGTEAGAYVSYDSGQTWGAINDGLVNSTIIYTLVVDRGSNVFAATPFGIFQLTKDK